MRTLIVVLTVSALSSLTAYAQHSNSIFGTITDTNGSVVAGASVRLVTAHQITIKAVESDASGKYRFDGVAEGTYSVIVSRPGFNSQSRNLNVSGTATIDLILSV